MHITIRLYPRRTTMLLFAGALFFMTISTAVGLMIAILGKDDAPELISDLYAMIDLNGEANLSTLFESGLLLIAAGLLLAISVYAKGEQKHLSKGWRFLGLIFIYLAVDESARIHEKFSKVSARMLDIEGHPFAVFSWIIPGSILVLVFGLIYLRFLKQIPRRTAALFIAAGALFITGAVVVELIEGIAASMYSENSAAFRVLVQVEESLEFTGIIVFIYALLEYMAAQMPKMNLAFDLREAHLNGDEGGSILGRRSAVK